MSWAVWITGPPGSGKSVLAAKTAEELVARGLPATVLEVYLASILTDVGIPVIIDATAHRRAWRDLARATISHFAEVQVTCPLAVCRERERRRAPGHAPQGIYAAAGRRGSTVPGVDVPYEPALNPEIVVDTATETPDVAGPRIVRVALDLAQLAGHRSRPTARPAWALWITGLPGSGKTTLASAVAEALATRGLAVRLLALDQLCDFVLAGALRSSAADELVHRALVCAARLLAEAGVPAIIDATAPGRRWRQLARELIPHYAEVQLMCPPEVCGTRERAGRWTPASWVCAGRPAVTRAPDIVLDYEVSLNPDLVVHTDLSSAWSATDEIVKLVHRLQRRIGESPCTSAIS
jgi:adenylylsulfate kinase